MFMSKLAPTSIKYVIKASLKANGVVEKPDIIGAVFGQKDIGQPHIAECIENLLILPNNLGLPPVLIELFLVWFFHSLHSTRKPVNVKEKSIPMRRDYLPLESNY